MSRAHQTRTAIVILGIGFVAFADAATITVGPSPADDFSTIQPALDFAGPGDEIVVWPGVYGESISFPETAVTLRSHAGANETVIDGQGADTVVRYVNGAGADTKLIGFTITGGNTTENGGGLLIENADLTIVNCRFNFNTATDGGGIYILGGSPLIVNCVFLGNAAVDASQSDGGAIRNAHGSNPTIVNCTFINNSATDTGGGVSNSVDCYPTFMNCIFWNNSVSGSMDEADQIYDGTTSASAVTYSCIQGLSAFAGSGNIGDDPLLAGTRLSLDSPCIDSGDTSSLPVGLYVDLDGKGRVVDSPAMTDTGIPATFVPATVDMGALEYHLPGDIDWDWDVDLADLAELLAHYGMSAY